jgi:hypothetical protein
MLKIALKSSIKIVSVQFFWQFFAPKFIFLSQFHLFFIFFSDFSNLQCICTLGAKRQIGKPLWCKQRGFVSKRIAETALIAGVVKS